MSLLTLRGMRAELRAAERALSEVIRLERASTPDQFPIDDEANTLLLAARQSNLLSSALWRYPYDVRIGRPADLTNLRIIPLDDDMDRLYVLANAGAPFSKCTISDTVEISFRTDSGNTQTLPTAIITPGTLTALGDSFIQLSQLMLKDPDFTTGEGWTFGPNWAITGVGTAGCATGGGVLSAAESTLNYPIVAGVSYLVTLNVTALGAGDNIKVSLSGTDGASITAAGRYFQTITPTIGGGDFVITASDTATITYALAAPLVNEWVLSPVFDKSLVGTTFGWVAAAGLVAHVISSEIDCTGGVHTGTATATLAQSFVVGATYTIWFEVQNYGAGQVWVSIGDASTRQFTGDGVHTEDLVHAGSTTSLVVHTSGFTGKITLVSAFRNVEPAGGTFNVVFAGT